MTLPPAQFEYAGLSKKLKGAREHIIRAKVAVGGPSTLGARGTTSTASAGAGRKRQSASSLRPNSPMTTLIQPR